MTHLGGSRGLQSRGQPGARRGPARRAQLGVADGTHTGSRLGFVSCPDTERSAITAYDDIAMGAGQPQHVVAVLIGQPPVVFADRCLQRVCTCAQASPPGNTAALGVGLDTRLAARRPGRDFLPDPFAVVDFRRPVVDEGGSRRNASASGSTVR